MKNPRIVAVHLLNDLSGSPFVLRQSLESLLKVNYPVILYTATPSGNGFLSNISGITEKPLFYRWHRNKWITLLFFCWSQFMLGVKLLWNLRRSDIVYINSLLPFGAALAARIRSCKVVYHIHEVSIKPELLKRFLVTVANLTADEGIFVSADLSRRTDFKSKRSIIPNSLPATFVQQACMPLKEKREEAPFSVLMLCSMKKYKGIMEFVACARRMPMLNFRMVLNAGENEIARFFVGTELPKNLQIYPATQNVHPFYASADVVVNLSHPDEWIETFGMTILEAMYYRKPVIVPPVGGIAELVEEGIEGFHINPYDIESICEKLRLMLSCPLLYRKLSMAAFKKASRYSPHAFSENIQRVFEDLNSQPELHPITAQLNLFDV